MQFNTGNNTFIARDKSIAEVFLIGNSSGGIVDTIGINHGAVTQTIINLPANTSTQIIGVNATRKSLYWMNIGNNPMTVVPGSTAAVAGSGMNYNTGGFKEFNSSLPTNAFQAISTLGTIVSVWEQN